MGEISISFVDSFGYPPCFKEIACFLVYLFYATTFILLSTDAAQKRSAYLIKAIG